MWKIPLETMKMRSIVPPVITLRISRISRFLQDEEENLTMSIISWSGLPGSSSRLKVRVRVRVRVRAKPSFSWSHLVLSALMFATFIKNQDSISRGFGF